jgi:hypothetical protein
MWSTRDPVGGTVVRYGANDLSQITYGTAVTFDPKVNVGELAQDVHTVHLTGLLPDTTYSYACGSDASGGGSSAVMHFTTARVDPTDESWAPSIAVYGDMGISTNAQDTLPWLLADLNAGEYPQRHKLIATPVKQYRREVVGSRMHPPPPSPFPPPPPPYLCF